jgi:chromosome segregation ATPase
MEGLQDFITQSAAERQQLEEICQLQGEKIEQLEQDLETFRNDFTDDEEDDQESGTFGQELTEKTAELEREIISLKNRVMNETGDKQKICEIEHLCYEMMNRFEQKFSDPGAKNPPPWEDNPEPLLRKKMPGTVEEIPVQNHKITGLWSEDQKTGDDEPIPDEEAVESWIPAHS